MTEWSETIRLINAVLFCVSGVAFVWILFSQRRTELSTGAPQDARYLAFTFLLISSASATLLALHAPGHLKDPTIGTYMLTVSGLASCYAAYLTVKKFHGMRK